MSRQLVVIGASGFGRETLDVLDAVNAAGLEPAFELVGVVDDGPSAENLSRLGRRSVQYLGVLERWLAGAVGDYETTPEYIVGIGAPSVRAGIAERFDAGGMRAATLIHPSARLGSGVSVAEGAVICAGALISTEVVLGRHCHINPGAVIGHDTRLGDFVSVNPNATVSGACCVKDRTLVGAGSVVLEELTVGCDAIIGAAACVTRDVPDRSLVKGVPGRW